MHLLLSLLLLGPAQATQVVASSAPCPIGDGSVRVFSKVSSDTHGGWDSDLASYSSRGQWRTYALSTCGDNLYSLYGVDMADKVTPEVAEASLARLAELRSDLDPTKMEVWDRYLIAAEMYRIRGADARMLYQLYLEASWTARDEAVGVYTGLEGPIPARRLLDQGREELKRTDLSKKDRKVLLHNLARVAHRGGWATERDEYMQMFEQVGSLDADEQRVLKRFRQITLQVEPALQQLAVEQLQSYLATSPEDPVELARATYLLADLARRLGKDKEAVAGFAIVMSAEAAPPQLRELSAFLGSLIDLE